MPEVTAVTDLSRPTRIPIQLPPEDQSQLEALANRDKRPVANMAAALLSAALELVNDQGFRLVDGKLRKIVIEDEED